MQQAERDDATAQPAAWQWRHSRMVIVFITERYIMKVDGEGERGDDDNCKFEFDHALRRKGVAALYPVVMEPSMCDTGKWIGIVGGKLGGKLYADFSEDNKLESAVAAIDKYMTKEFARQASKGEVRA